MEAAPDRELARALIASEVPLPPLADPLAVAWALKDACHAAWNTSPRDAVRAAARLREIASRVAQPELASRLAPIGDWTRGIAALSEGRSAEAVTAFDEARTRFAEAGDARHAAETQVPKVVALSMLGRHDEALACAMQALEGFAVVGDERSAGKLEINVGTMLSRRDRHAEAAAQYRRAAVRFARIGDVEHSVMADIGLANALTWLHEFDEALRVNARARMRARSRGLTVLLGLAHGAIGRIELLRGQHPAALHELAAASRLLADAGAAPQRCIDAETALADAYLLVNLLPEAVALYDRLIAQADAIDAPVEGAWATLQRARALERLGRLDDALQGLAEARARFAALDNTPSVVLAELATASVQLRSGDLAAASAAARAAKVLEDRGMTAWRLEAVTLVADAAAAGGQHAEAERHYRRLLDEGCGLATIELAAQRGLGALAARRGDAEAARRHLEAALDAVEQARAALPGDAFRTAYAAEGERAHDLLVDTEARAGRAAAPRFEAIERGRSRAFALALREGGRALGAAAQAERMRLQWLRSRRGEALGEGDAAAVQRLEEQIRAAEAGMLEADRRDRLAEARPPAHRSPLPRAGEVQAALAPDQAMLAYHRIGERLHAVVLTPRSARAFELAIPGFDRHLEGLRFQLESQRFGAAALRAHGPALTRRARVHLETLHAQVWAPLADALDGTERVVVLPHRALHYLPFCALHDGQQALVERHELTIAASASAWLAAREGPAPRLERALVAGFGGPTLPQVALEVDAVAEAFGPQAVRLLGSEATHAALREGVAGADVVHIACHGHFRADNPMFSALELADGPLSLHEAQALPLSAALVALSACETGVSRVAPGDELVGLVRAFLTAGARSVLASAWPVADESTASLMRGFYRLLQHGARPAAALRSVQRERARGGEHPFHWAAFSLHGRG